MIKIPEAEIHPLKFTLRKRGLTQLQAAKMLGISVSSLSHILNGYRQIPPEIREHFEMVQKSLEAGEIVR